MKHHRIIWITAATCLLAAGLGFTEPADRAEEAFQLRMQARTDEALQLLEKDLAANPRNARSLFEMSRTKLYLMDFDGMSEAIGKAVEIEPENAAYHHFAGLFTAYSLIDAAHHNDEEKMRECGQRVISELEAAVRVDPDLHDARCLLVQQLTDGVGPELGLDASAAEEHVRVLEEKDPVMGAKARSNLLDDAWKRELWEDILAEHGDEALACYEAGFAFIDLGDLPRAADCIDKAIKLDPARYYILLRLGTAYAIEKEWDRAREVIERYIRLNPPVPLKAFAFWYLGQIGKRSGKPAEGRKFMDKAVAMDAHLWKTFMPPPEVLFTKP